MGVEGRQGQAHTGAENRHTRRGEMKRFCYTIIIGQCDEHGYIPSAVFEGERGHNPMTGNGDYSAPWYWGKTYEQAKEVCADYNRNKLGLSDRDIAEIVCSSMFALTRR